MRNLKIKSADFINWFFHSGADQDQKQEAIDLGVKVIEGLVEGKVTITPQDILNQCEALVIPLYLVEGFEGVDLEIEEALEEGLINTNFTIKLV